MLASDHQFVQTATRPLNIVEAAKKKGIATSDGTAPSKLDSREASELGELVETAKPSIALALRSGDPVTAAREAEKLAKAINNFMDSTMIMVDDDDIRTSRLHLLEEVGQALLQIGDFTKLVIEG